MDKKYKLIDSDRSINGVKLYQVEALKDFGLVKKGDKGGYIESENNLSQEGDCWVSGNAWVYENAKVYGDARIEGKNNYTKGWFIGGDDTGKITEITEKTGSEFWKAQYVLGDYEITPQEEEKKKLLLN